MRNNPYNLRETVDVNGTSFYLVTKEVLDDYVYMRESLRRKDNSRKVISKQEVLDLMGCSESTLYRKLRNRNCRIKKGSVNGTFVKSSVLDEMNR